MADAGYQIGNKFYPFPTSFRMLDPVLIRDLTGLKWDEFLDLMPDDDEPEALGDPVVMAGMFGVAVWQVNTTWRRDRVVKYVQGINIEAVQAVGVEDAEGDEEDDASPPEATNGSKESEKQASRSKSDLDSASGTSPRRLSGSQPSATTPE